MIFNRILLFFSVIFIITACSGSVDTSNFTPEEYFNYALGLYNDGDYEQAVIEFQNIGLQFPGSIFNDDAAYYLAMTYFQRKQYLLSAYEFSKLIRNYSTSPFVPDAQFMLAEAYYQLSPPYPLDQSYTKKAIEEFQAFIEFFPANPKVEEASRKIQEMNEKLAQKDFQSALIYERMEYERAAIKYYGFVTDTYHDTQYGPMALYNKIKLQIKKEMNNEALLDIGTFLSRYPNHPSVSELTQIERRLTNSVR